MSFVVDVLADPGVELTFLPAEPPRSGRFALWRQGDPVDGHDETLELALPRRSQVRRTQVPVRYVGVEELLDGLVELPASRSTTESVRAWATAARLAVELVGRGRLRPGSTEDGIDTWRLGPFDPEDIRRRRALVEAMPAAAHAVPVPGSKPLAILSPGPIVEAFGDAVADVLPRTAAAAIVAGQDAFASEEETWLDPTTAAWLSSIGIGSDDVSTALRLIPPPDDDGEFTAALQVGSHADPSLLIDAVDLWAAPDAVASRFGDDVDTKVLLAIRRGAQVWPPMKRLLDQAHPDAMTLSDTDVDDLLGDTVEYLASAGIQVLWPSSFIAPVELRAVVTTPSPAAVTSAGLTLDQVAQLEWAGSIDGADLTEAEIDALVHAKRSLVRLRGRWVRADPAKLARLQEKRELASTDALAVALGGSLIIDGDEVDADVEGPIAELAERLHALGDRTVDVPAELEATLRDYQHRGLEWLVEMAELGLGGVLADDMGLGKTIQVLALHLARKSTGRPTLVVCPATLMGNWEREAEHFTPGIPVRRYHGADRSLVDIGSDEIVVVTYGVVRRDADLLAETEWGLVVADEAQAVKNPLSRTARALRKIVAPARFALTGTPVENRLTDLWALLDWTTPGLLGDLESFRRNIAVPVERHRDEAATDSLSRLVRPFLLRRRKTDPDIAPELPPKTETDQIVGLTTEQATLYRATSVEVLAQIQEAEGINRRGLVLKLITALKQICNHPAQYLDQPDTSVSRSAKLSAVDELIDVIVAEGDATLIFTQYVKMGRILDDHFAGQGKRTRYLHGSVPVKKRQAMVDDFQNGEADVFVISLKAGGTGLNLTRATHVVHYDRWWNPAVEDQASDRAWRIGQDRAVQVHRMICEGTLEDRIAKILEEKRDLADAVVGGGEAWISEMTDAELVELVALGS